MSTEDDVRKASTQFYASLNRMVGGDSASMADIWSHSREAGVWKIVHHHTDTSAAMLDILSRLQAPAS